MGNTVKDEDADRTVIAIENPIGAVFDLTEKMSKEFPEINKKFEATFLFGMIVSAILILAFAGLAILCLYLGIFELAILALIPIALSSIMAILLIRSYRGWTHLKNFFARRYNAIQAVQYSNPVVPVPPGKTLADRFLTHLWYSYPRLQTLIKTDPQAIQVKSNQNDSINYFDAYIQQKPDSTWQYLGSGSPGYGFYIKSFDHMPSIEDIKILEQKVQEISLQSSIPPSRAVALFRISNYFGELDQDTYDYLINHSITVRMKKREYKCPIQAVIEMEDNNYDFIPLIPTVPNELP
ncbi:MAG: hypothetical protein JSW28_08780 [Thermoplasmata archaeon]|nr:MAG: hypothetical protein JSW28_08780 [Thermoplasmata archaeon]